MSPLSESGTLPTVPSTRPPKKPQYCRQRNKGRADRAYVRIDGKTIWLGVYGSPESRRRYEDLTSGDTSAPPPPATDTVTTVAMVMAAYLEFAQGYYRHLDGTPGREFATIRGALRFVRKNCSDLPAKDFGPRKLKEIRKAMVDNGYTRKTVNKHIDRVRRMFKWAVEEEMVPPGTYHGLQAVRPLKRGRTTAPDKPPVAPVGDADVEATLEHLPQVVADMVRLQRLTAMRGGELVQMRPCDVDRSGDVWIYRPARHKTLHHDHNRTVMIGPRGQEILLRYLVRDSQAYCFRPCDSEEKRLAEREANRKTAKSCGNVRGSNRVENPKRQPGEAYTSDSYRRAVERACDKAGIARWTPHQLRHSAATEIRAKFGLEAAQIALGHASADITQVYALRDLAKGVEVARAIG